MEGLANERQEALEKLQAVALRSAYVQEAVVGLTGGAPLLMARRDTPEAPATHLFRQELGIYNCILLAPVQTALYRAAQAGELGERTRRRGRRDDRRGAP